MTPGKFDDRQIEGGALANLGKEIAARLQKVQAYEVAAREKAGVELQKAQDHRDAIAKLLYEARAKCRGSGFKVFKEKYCPDLGRSRIYELLAIGSGKKSLEESRADKRASVAKSRRKASATSPPVADTPEAPPVAVTPEIGPSATIAAEKSAEKSAEALSTDPNVTENAEAGAKANAEANADGEPEWFEKEREEGRVLPFVIEGIDRDEYLLDRLSALLLELKKLTKKPPDRFAGCEIEPSDLETAADFLHRVAAKIRERTNLEIPGFLRRPCNDRPLEASAPHVTSSSGRRHHLQHVVLGHLRPRRQGVRHSLHWLPVPQGEVGGRGVQCRRRVPCSKRVRSGRRRQRLFTLQRQGRATWVSTKHHTHASRRTHTTRRPGASRRCPRTSISPTWTSGSAPPAPAKWLKL
jgi:hypothetical protein